MLTLSQSDNIFFFVAVKNIVYIVYILYCIYSMSLLKHESMPLLDHIRFKPKVIKKTHTKGLKTNEAYEGDGLFDEAMRFGTERGN